MPEITVHRNGKIRTIHVRDGKTLRDALHENGYDVYSPCGGKGKCGKCNIFINREGTVTSCLYTVVNDIEVILPDKKEGEILVAQHEHIIDISFSPGSKVHLSSRPMGVAIDIGTTTLVFYLTDLLTGSQVEVRSALNPQGKYGADVISRINYCAENAGGLEKLQMDIINSINTQLKHFFNFAGIVPENIVKVAVAGNTVMLHLFLSVDPLSIALAPYIPVFTERRIVQPDKLGINVHPEAEIKLLPSVSAFVGADIISGLASIRLYPSIKNFIYIDIGTNGELVLVTPDKNYCCATAAGPAFEGANITCGMGAFEGAISEFTSEGFKTIADAKPAGICGSGLIDIIAVLLEDGIITSEGYMEKDYIIVAGEHSASGEHIRITPADVREVQLAKSAIMSGIRILLRISGIRIEDVDRIYLAGGFGNYLKISNAVRIGLLPEELKDKIIPVGNASGTGAVLSLKSDSFDKITDNLILKTIYTELSLNEDFPLEFAMNMLF